MPDVHRLIEDAFAGRRLTASEVQAIAEHIAAAGFDAEGREVAGPRIAGLVWRGVALSKDSRLSTAEAHYLRHVVAQLEWPPGTSIERYQASVTMMAQGEDSGVFISERRGGRTAGVVGRSGEWQGPAGHPWMLVEFRVMSEHWITAFQPWRGLDHLIPDGKARRTLQWLRPPK